MYFTGKTFLNEKAQLWAFSLMRNVEHPHTASITPPQGKALP